jgi:ATP-dependent Lon protease
MRDFRDAKAMAQTLREALKAKSVSLTHSESLELVAKLLGFHDWNVLSARIASEHRPVASAPIALPLISVGARLPTVPLRDFVVFPKMDAPLLMGREASKRAVEHALAGDQRVLAVTQRRATDDNPAAQDLYGIGVVASVMQHAAGEGGTVKLAIKCIERAAIVHMTEDQFLTAEIAPFRELRGQEAEAFSLMGTVLETFQAYHTWSPSTPAYLRIALTRLQNIRQPSVLADAVAPFLLIDIARRQDLLETSDVIARLEKILAVMKAGQQAA